ncbi:MAG TPA: hypothetical protein VGC45_05735 [Gryllotalpicola sp.]
MAKSGEGDGVSDSADREDDPEVTAITRKLDRTGDTLGAIEQLQALIIERTGQIPVVTPEMLAAANAPRGAAGESSETEAEAEVDIDAPVDWSLPVRELAGPQPGFSPWIDPELTAAAQDTAPREFTDVSTQVFAVFSASEPEPEPEPEPAATPHALPLEQLEQQFDPDVVDDADDVRTPAPLPVSEAPRPPAPMPTPVAAAAPAPGSVPLPAPLPVPARRRHRFWPFGRR